MTTFVDKLEVLVFNDQKEMFETLESILDSADALEEFFGVEFADSNGIFPSDDEDNYNVDNIDFSNFRDSKHDNAGIGFPKSFPAHLMIFKVSYSSRTYNIYARWADDTQD